MVQADNDASRERLRRLIEKTDATALADALPGGWTVSALLAHLAWWDRLALQRWQDYLRSGTRPTWIADEINDEMLPQWLTVPPHDAVREVLAAAAAVDGLIAGLPDAVVEEVKRSGWERGAERHRHRNEHLDEIERLSRRKD